MLLTYLSSYYNLDRVYIAHSNLMDLTSVYTIEMKVPDSLTCSLQNKRNSTYKVESFISIQISVSFSELQN